MKVIGELIELGDLRVGWRSAKVEIFFHIRGITHCATFRAPFAQVSRMPHRVYRTLWLTKEGHHGLSTRSNSGIQCTNAIAAV